MNEEKASETLKQVNELCVTHTISEVVEILSKEWKKYLKRLGTENHVYLKSKCYANTRLLLHKNEDHISVYMAIPPAVNTWHSSF
jgi:glucose-6-phosphate 1-dehydrogenase